MAVFHSAANRHRVSAVSAILASCLIVGGIVPCRLVADDAPGSLELVEMSSAGGAVLKKLDDGSILVTGKNADKDVYVVVANSDLKKITGLRLEALKHDSLPSGGPGRLFNGTFILTRVEITAAPQKTNEPARAVAIKTATADFTQKGHSVLNLIDGKPGPGWAIWDDATANRQVDFQFDKPLAWESGAKLTITLKHESVWAGGNLGCFRLSMTTHEDWPLPTSVDLRPQFAKWKLPPRGQGERNTCSVFVTVGAFEFALSKRHDRGIPLSVEYSNWACNQVIRNSAADRGQFFHDLLKGYEKHGLCGDELMPYEKKFQNAEPSEAAQRDANANRRLGFEVHWIRPWSKNTGLTDKQFNEIRRTLANGWPVCAGSDHSRLLVGYVDDVQQPGGGKFLTRDSGLGEYSEVTYDWIRKNIYDLFWVQLPDNEIKNEGLPAEQRR